MTTASTPRTEVQVVTVAPRSVLGQRERVGLSGLPAFFSRPIAAVAAELARAGIAPEGPPTAVYRYESGNTFEVTVGFPVSGPPDARTGGDRRAEPAGAPVLLRLPGGSAVQAEHAGSYRTLPD